MFILLFLVLMVNPSFFHFIITVFYKYKMRIIQIGKIAKPVYLWLSLHPCQTHNTICKQDGGTWKPKWRSVSEKSRTWKPSYSLLVSRNSVKSGINFRRNKNRT